MNILLPRRKFLTTTALSASALLMPAPLRAWPFVAACVLFGGLAVTFLVLVPLCKRVRDKPPKKDEEETELTGLRVSPEPPPDPDDEAALQCIHYKDPCAGDGGSDLIDPFNPPPAPLTLRLTGRLQLLNGAPSLGALKIRRVPPSQLVDAAEHDRLLRALGVDPVFRGASYGKGGRPIDEPQSSIKFIAKPGGIPDVSLIREGLPAAQVAFETSTDLNSRAWFNLSTITTSILPGGQDVICSIQPETQHHFYRLRLLS